MTPSRRCGILYVPFCEFGEIEGDLEASKIVYRKFNKDAVNASPMMDAIEYCVDGLNNSQLLTIAPTGTQEINKNTDSPTENVIVG